MPEFLKVLLVDIANGGFGPGYGLIGVGSGHVDFGNGNLETVYLLAHSEGLNKRFVIETNGIVPFCNWGCGIYSCLDCGSSSNGSVLLYNPEIDFFSSQNIRSIEIRDASGKIRSRTEFGKAESPTKPCSVHLTPHRKSLADWMTAWVNGESLWDEIEKLSPKSR